MLFSEKDLDCAIEQLELVEDVYTEEDYWFFMKTIEFLNWDISIAYPYISKKLQAEHDLAPDSKWAWSVNPLDLPSERQLVWQLRRRARSDIGLDPMSEEAPHPEWPYGQQMDYYRHPSRYGPAVFYSNIEQGLLAEYIYKRKPSIALFWNIYERNYFFVKSKKVEPSDPSVRLPALPVLRRSIDKFALELFGPEHVKNIEHFEMVKRLAFLAEMEKVS